jgi:acyl-CoA synthetase (AMP-forming)/AMP-acid ligase II
MDALHSLTLADVLRELRRSWPRKTALVCGADRYTYPEFDDRASRLANALAGAGVGQGDRILWLGQNCHRVLEGLLAASKLGAVFCPANWRQSPEELAFVIDDSAPAVVVWQQEEIGEAVRAARERAGGPGLWLQHDAPRDAEGSYEAFLAGGSHEDPGIEVDPAAPVLQMYTAAFTGRPNGALLSSQAIVAQDCVMAKLQDVTADDVFLNSGPLFHIATFMTTLATFHFGGTNVFTRRVDAEELCRLIDAEKVTGAFLVGPTIGQIVEANRDRTYDLSSLRTFKGSHEWNEMITVDHSPWARRPGGYGQTEVMGMLTFNAFGPGAVGTHGRPSPLVQVRIVDEDGSELAPGEVGEIVARGPTVMAGYLNRPELNAERQRGGWHRTNDLGRREDDGSITFIGPKSKMIKSAAENIYPAEVEGCIQRHPAVAEVCVIGVPDPVWTQSVKALVKLKKGETATADDIVEHCRAHIASYKKPRIVEFVDDFPRDKIGFVDRDRCDELYGGGGYPGGRNRSA